MEASYKLHFWCLLWRLLLFNQIPWGRFLVIVQWDFFLNLLNLSLSSASGDSQFFFNIFCLDLGIIPDQLHGGDCSPVDLHEVKQRDVIRARFACGPHFPQFAICGFRQSWWGLRCPHTHVIRKITFWTNRQREAVSIWYGFPFSVLVEKQRNHYTGQIENGENSPLCYMNMWTKIAVLKIAALAKTGKNEAEGMGSMIPIKIAREIHISGNG